MKCILYISEVTTTYSVAMIPTGLAEIYRISQKHNRLKGITGILSFRRSHYIQIIEGDNSNIDTLYSKISRDSRHSNLTLLLNTKIATRSFPDWNMKLLTSVNDEKRFVNFLHRFLPQFQDLDLQKRQLLEIFYKKGNISSFSYEPANNRKKFADSDLLSLTSWPDFSTLKYSPPTVELVARLIKRAQIYKELISCGEFGNKRQIDRLLSRLDKLGLLKIDKSKSVQTKPIAKSSKANKRFYSKMKNFLGMH